MQALLDAIARARGSFTCTDDDLNNWLDAPTIAVMKKLEIFVFNDAAKTIICPECGCHPVTPEFRGVDGNGIRCYVLTCDDPSIGTVDYAANLTSYSLDLPKLAQTISAGLHLTGNMSEPIAGQMFILGIKQVNRGSVRCYLLLTDNIEHHKKLFEDSSKTASTVIFYGHTVPTSFIDTVAVVHIADLLTFSGNQIKINEEPLIQAASRLFGTNSYKNQVLTVRDVPIVTLKKGTLLDIVLRFVSSPERIDKTVTYRDILAHYNKQRKTRKGAKNEDLSGADQWWYVAVSELRTKCGENAELVDVVLAKGGQENKENSVIFLSRA